MSNDREDPPIRSLEVPECRFDSVSTLGALSSYNLTDTLYQDFAPVCPGRVESIPRMASSSSERFKVEGRQRDLGVEKPGRKKSIVRMPDRRPICPPRLPTARSLVSQHADETSASSSSSGTTDADNRPPMIRCSGGINLFR